MCAVMNKHIFDLRFEYANLPTTIPHFGRNLQTKFNFYLLSAVVPKLVRTVTEIKAAIMSYYPPIKNFRISCRKFLLQ